MEKVVVYQIKQGDFKKLEKLAERIYNTTVVIDYFCKTQTEIDELANLAPIIKNLKHDADNLNVFFINFLDSIA